MTGGATTLHHFGDDPAAPVALAATLGIPTSAIRVHHFPDGESLPIVETPGSRAIIYRSSTGLTANCSRSRSQPTRCAAAAPRA